MNTHNSSSNTACNIKALKSRVQKRSIASKKFPMPSPSNSSSKNRWSHLNFCANNWWLKVLMSMPKSQPWSTMERTLSNGRFNDGVDSRHLNHHLGRCCCVCDLPQRTSDCL